MSDSAIVSLKDSASLNASLSGHDRIFVRDYVVDCNIGVFEEEQGVTQKVGFTIEAAVGVEFSTTRDDIDDVPSYDDLTNAVDETLDEGHINLVETMAAHIAERVLKDSRFVWVRVRVEKLERGPAAVGIEIVRRRG